MRRPRCFVFDRLLEFARFLGRQNQSARYAFIYMYVSASLCSFVLFSEAATVRKDNDIFLHSKIFLKENTRRCAKLFSGGSCDGGTAFTGVPQ